MPRHRGTCHCGSVTFAFTATKITEVLRCTCSICKRKGTALSNFTIPPEEMEITSRDDALSTYRFGTKVAKHHFCKRCGISPFVETRLNPGEYRVNLGCVDAVDTLSLPVVIFDGTSI